MPINLQGPTMLYVDIPTVPEFKALATVRGDACVSIYLPTTPLPQDTAVSRAQLETFGKTALDQLDEAGCDKRRQASIRDHLAELEEDDEFWRFQAHSLAVLLTPETMRTFRLPNRLRNRSPYTNFPKALPTPPGVPRSMTDRLAGAFRAWRGRRCYCVNIA